MEEITKEKLEKAVRMRDLAEEYGLVGATLLREMTAHEIAQTCNGIGAECMGETVRNILDSLSPNLVPCAYCHDALFAFLPKTSKAFYWANRTLSVNAARTADAVYADWRIFSKWLLRREGRGAECGCNSIVGSFAWTQAHEDARAAFPADRLAQLQAAAEKCMA